MYAITHKGKSYGPDGIITDMDGVVLPASSADDYNQQVQAQQLSWLSTHPAKVMLYVTINPDTQHYRITTCLGHVLDSNPYISPKRVVGFQSYYRGGTYRHAVTCKLFGTTYHGWYFASSGQYCRLTRAKVQPK